MKLLIVGAGSIGRRHAHHAREHAELIICDIDHDRAKSVADETGAIPCAGLDEALAHSPDIAIVATPHKNHVESATTLLHAGCDVLVEKPISDQILPARKLVELAGEKGRRLFVVCNMRFHPGPDTLKTNLHRIGQPLFARAYFGQWLADMRPGTDYRQLYCSRRETGGGVVLDAIHEIDYLMWMLGPVSTVTGTTAHLSSLEIDVEDYAAIILEHLGGARSEIHLDYLQSFKRRGCEIVGTTGTLFWESEGTNPEYCRVRLFLRGKRGSQLLYESENIDPDAMYRALMNRFISAVSADAPVELLSGSMAVEELTVALTAKSTQR